MLMRPSSRRNLLEAFALLSADQIVCGDPEIFKNQFGAIDRPVAQFLELLTDAKTLSLLADEQAHSAVRR